jgi:hypothetical protein
MDDAAITRLLHGPGGVKARHEAANRVMRKWIGNIHRRTGETQLLLHLSDTIGRTYIETSTAAPTKDIKGVNLSAWLWLEYGTAKMRAQAPGRRALGDAAVK